MTTLCPICYLDCHPSPDFLLTCTYCDESVCVKCQKLYAKDICMFCKVRFSRRTLKVKLGTKFVRDTLDPQTALAELARQKQQLPGVQPVVDWTILCEQIGLANRSIRVAADKIPLPSKPIVASSGLTGRLTIPCPRTGCRGHIPAVDISSGLPIIGVSACSMCSHSLCTSCRSPCSPGTDHVCDPNVVSNLAEIFASTKPCPTCDARIAKTEGCDHMMCTGCNTHFSWKTLRVCKTLYGTNHPHYAHNATSNSTLTSDPAANERPEPRVEPVLDGDRVPWDVFIHAYAEIKSMVASRSPQKDLIDRCVMFWTHGLAYDIRLFIVQHRITQDEVVESLMRKHELNQVAFVRGTLTELQWGNRITAANASADYSLSCFDLLCRVLAKAYEWQSRLYNQFRVFADRWLEDPEVDRALTDMYADLAVDMRLVVQSTNVQLYDAFEERLESGNYVSLWLPGGSVCSTVDYRKYLAPTYTGSKFAKKGGSAEAKEVPPIVADEATATEAAMVDRMVCVFEKSMFALDRDDGLSLESKVFGLWVAGKRMGMKHVVFIANKGVETACDRAFSARRCDRACVHVVTPSQLTGTCAQPTCPFVSRLGTIYFPTMEWTAMVMAGTEGVLLVIDSTVLGKTKAACTALCSDITRDATPTTVNANTRSRLFVVQGGASHIPMQMKDGNAFLEMIMPGWSIDRKIQFTLLHGQRKRAESSHIPQNYVRILSGRAAHRSDTIEATTVLVCFRYVLWPRFGVSSGVENSSTLPLVTISKRLLVTNEVGRGGSGPPMTDQDLVTRERCAEIMESVVADVYNRDKRCILVANRQSTVDDWSDRFAGKENGRGRDILVTTYQKVAKTVASDPGANWFCVAIYPRDQAYAAVLMTAFLSVPGESTVLVCDAYSGQTEEWLTDSVVLTEPQRSRVVVRATVKDPSRVKLYRPNYSLT